MRLCMTSVILVVTFIGGFACQKLLASEPMIDAMDVVLTDVSDDNIICKAYWSGFYFDPMSHRCEKGGASGCSNPFPYQTLEECENSIARFARE